MNLNLNPYIENNFWPNKEVCVINNISIGATSLNMTTSYTNKIDFMPYHINEIRRENRIFKITKKIECKIYIEQSLFIVEYSPLNILAYDSTREKAIQNFHEEFSFLWDTYAKEEDKNLTYGAKKIKNKLLSLVKKS